MANFTLSSRPFPALQGVHRGTGRIGGSAHVWDPATVDKDIGTQLGLWFKRFDIQFLSLETDAPEPPNWFGVSFRQAITSFNSVNIFCHPSPGGAGMVDGDYASRSGNWPKLFRYAEILGRQMSIANSNLITVVPFFTGSTYGNTGIFGANWVDLVEQIIVHVRNARAGSLITTAAPRAQVTEVERLILADATTKRGAPPARSSSNLLRNVVLSGFSFGRVLAANVRHQARGMSSFIREAWDFDGVGGSPPGAPRILTYDQHKRPDGIKDHFHVPPERWLEYHHAVIKNVHGDIPAMLACHAAAISSVGK